VVKGAPSQTQTLRRVAKKAKENSVREKRRLMTRSKPAAAAEPATAVASAPAAD